MPSTQIIENIKDSSIIPDKVKKASAKILTEYGYTVRAIAELTGLGVGTVHRVGKEDRADITEVDPETWNMAEQAIKKVIKAKQDQLAAKTLAKIEGKLNDDKAPLGTLAFLYKVLSEANTPKESKNITNNNIQVKVVRESYSDTDSVIQGVIVPESSKSDVA